MALNGFFDKVGWNFRFKDDKDGPFLGKFDLLTNDGVFVGKQVLFDVSRQFGLGPTTAVTTKFSFTQSGTRERLTMTPPNFTLFNPRTDSVLTRFPQGMKGDYSANIRGYVGEVTVQKDLSDRQRITAGTAFDAESTYNVDSRANFSGSATDLTIHAEPELQKRPDLIHGSRRIGSLFLQDEWSMSRAVSFTTGIRFDHYNDFGSTLNPRVAMVWRMPHNVYSKFLYGRAFRAPTFNELSYNSGGTIVGNPALRPDVIHTLEVSVGKKTKNFRGSLNYFLNDINNLTANIVRLDPRSGQPVSTVTWANLPGMTTHGLEIEAQRSFGINHTVFANYTYQRPRLKPTGQRVPEVPQHLLNLGATVGISRYVSFSPTLTARGQRVRDPGDPRPAVAGSGILNVNIRLRNFFGALEFNGTLNNALNTKYKDPEVSLYSQDAIVDYPRPGRQILS